MRHLNKGLDAILQDAHAAPGQLSHDSCASLVFEAFAILTSGTDVSVIYPCSHQINVCYIKLSCREINFF